MRRELDNRGLPLHSRPPPPTLSGGQNSLFGTSASGPTLMDPSMLNGKDVNGKRARNENEIFSSQGIPREIYRPNQVCPNSYLCDIFGGD